MVLTEFLIIFMQNIIRTSIKNMTSSFNLVFYNSMFLKLELLGMADLNTFYIFIKHSALTMSLFQQRLWIIQSVMY